jgi:hypothetical protein
VSKPIRERPFLFVGILTFSLFVIVEWLNYCGATEAALALGGPMRWLIIPMYPVWLLFTVLLATVADSSKPPGVLASVLWIISLGAGLMPYVLADYLLLLWRRRAGGHVRRTS